MSNMHNLPSGSCLWSMRSIRFGAPVSHADTTDEATELEEPLQLRGRTVRDPRGWLGRLGCRCAAAQGSLPVN